MSKKTNNSCKSELYNSSEAQPLPTCDVDRVQYIMGFYFINNSIHNHICVAARVLLTTAGLTVLSYEPQQLQ